MNARALFALAAGLTLLASAPVSASEGRIPIDQATVNAAGGFPFVIATPGSYVLIGNLTNPSAAIAAIVVQANDVTLDLGGFAIVGPAHCTGFGATLTCTGTGAGAGVASTGARTRVRNGTIRGAGSHGISLAGADGRVEQVRCTENGGSGVFAGGANASGAVVTNSQFERNAGDGFTGGAGAQALESFADGNLASGFVIGTNGLALHDFASDNGLAGIRSLGAGSVRQNVVFGLDAVGPALQFSGNGGYGENYLVGGTGFPDVSGAVAPNDPDQLAPNLCGVDTVCP